MKKLDIACIFKKDYVGENFFTVNFESIIIGSEDKNKKVFKDILTDEDLVNIKDIKSDSDDYFYGYSMNIGKLFKKMNTSNIEKVINKYYEKIVGDNIFYVDSKGFFNRVKEEKFTNKIHSGELKVKNSESLELDDNEMEYENIHIVYDKLRDFIVGQDLPIKKLLTAIYKEVLTDFEETKSNILVMGPEGVGKSSTMKYLGLALDVPVLIEDMRMYMTFENIYGLFPRAYAVAEGDLKKAQRSIIVFNHLDKKATDFAEGNVATLEEIIMLINKIKETGVYQFEYQGQQVSMDASNMIFVYMGEFKNLNSTMGYENDSKNGMNKHQLLLNYGIPYDLVGQIDTFVEFNKLTLDDYKAILKNSANSIITCNKNLFKDLGIDATYSDEFIDYVAIKGFELGLGVKGLKFVVDETLNEVMYNSIKYFGNNEIDKLNLDEIVRKLKK